jgi:hypothetical protein
VAPFLARGPSWTEAEREGTETISTLKASFAEALGLVEDGGITHAPTCVLPPRARGRIET